MADRLSRGPEFLTGVVGDWCGENRLSNYSDILCCSEPENEPRDLSLALQLDKIQKLQKSGVDEGAGAKKAR